MDEAEAVETGESSNILSMAHLLDRRRYKMAVMAMNSCVICTEDSLSTSKAVVDCNGIYKENHEFMGEQALPWSLTRYF